MKARIGDIDIHYTIEGQGPWVTMSHSLACDISMWDAQAKLLAPHFTVLRFDTRGHGQSSATAGPYSMDMLAGDVHGLLQHLKIDHTHWVGLSMGGMIGQAYALAHPGVFSSLVLADTTSRRPPNAAQMWGDRIKLAHEKGMTALVEGTLSRWFTEPYRQREPAMMARIGQGIANTPVNGFAGCCAAIAEVDYLDRLKEIKAPALVIVGDQDHGTPPEMAKLIHENLPGSEFLVIKDAAHIANIEQEAVFNQALLGFLRRH